MSDEPSVTYTLWLGAGVLLISAKQTMFEQQFHKSHIKFIEGKLGIHYKIAPRTPIISPVCFPFLVSSVLVEISILTNWTMTLSRER